MDSKHTRREFLKGLGVAGAGMLAPGRTLGKLIQQPSRAGQATVVLVKNAASQSAEHVYDAAVVKKMVFEAVRRLSGESSDKAAWSKYFRPSDVVGVKVNCLFGKGASTHPEVALAVAAGIQLAGVKPENVIIWDRGDADLIKTGYAVNRDGPGVKCYGTNGEYDEAATQQGSFHGRLTKILSEKVTALVNVPILKDHRMSGITVAFKNHFGTINNPGANHGGQCDPFLADLNSVPAIRNKTRLIVCDAIRPQCDGGPGLNTGAQWDFNAILASTDPVALDTHALRIIEERRKEAGMPTLADAGQPCRYLTTAAKLELGVGDIDKIKLVKVG